MNPKTASQTCTGEHCHTLLRHAAYAVTVLACHLHDTVLQVHEGKELLLCPAGMRAH